MTNRKGLGAILLKVYTMSDDLFEKHYYNLKGRNAEETINQLAFKSFLTEWCYPNPKLPDGKEICDLLIYYDGVMLICSIKNIEYKGNDERYYRKAYKDSIKQIIGAERTLTSGIFQIELSNPSGYTHKLEPEYIRNIHRLAISTSDCEIIRPYYYEQDGKCFHLFDYTFEEFMNELDTVSDFTKYLRDKETLLGGDNPAKILISCELDLLAEYVYWGKTFDRFNKRDRTYAIEGGIWGKISSWPQYKLKQRANRISYFCDHLIDITHTCPGDDYRHVARE
jgi:hypothetical protein